MAAAATARREAPPTPSRRVRVSSRHAGTKAKSASARTSQQPLKAPARRPGGQLIPIAVGTATAVRHLPDSSLMVRMTRGRTWIGVLGVLLAGIVAVNVVTLSLAASAGQIDRNIAALESENSLLGVRDAERSGSARVRHDAGALGLAIPTTDQIGYVRASAHAVAVAAQRLAAAGSGY
jgi:hypothetical protein